MDEVRLIDSAKRGNVQAFNTLVLHYQDAAYNFALRMMGDPASAADATQQAFISAYKALNRFEHGNFKGWLFRIVNNKCLDALRSQKRRPEPSIDQITEENESPSFLRDKGASPEDQMASSQTFDAIQSCLLGLPEGQRSVVVLYDVEGYDYQQIAHILEVSLGTVKSRINRARRKLQDCLRGFLELLPGKYR
ncbi:MAG: RNA polymerase sigma factor [Candidatus Promineifilaceae bacterium]